MELIDLPDGEPTGPWMPESLTVRNPLITQPVVIAGFLDVTTCGDIQGEASEESWLQSMVTADFEAPAEGASRVDLGLRTALERTTPFLGHPWLFERIANALTAVNRRCYQFDVTGWPTADQPRHLCYRASQGGMFVDHVDIGEFYSTRKLSFTVQLSDPADYEGGRLVFPSAKEVAPVDQGSLVVFPSFLPHRVELVTGGTRHALVGWLHGPTFR